MSNPYFQFKQFTVFHELCAMKVGTDGVLLGAWASAENPRQILDIGTGSGLIALMLAQRNPQAYIEAIDVEPSAIIQASINIEKSPWVDRIGAQKISLHDFAKATSKQFDLIVCNPPYFIESLKSWDKKRNIARHTDMLTHESLVSLSKSLLTPDGKFCLILPPNEANLCADFAERAGLYYAEEIIVYSKPQTEPKRVLMRFSLKNTPKKVSTLIIETGKRHEYTPEFKALVKDFYLHL